MRRVIFLLIVVLILLVAAFTIGFGWYLYIPEKISQIVGAEKEQAPVPVIEPKEEQEIKKQKEITLKIGEKAAYRTGRNAQINVTITNIDAFEGDAKVMATLYYARKPVTTKVADVSLKAKETKIITIDIYPGADWNAFDVEQI